MTQLLLLWTSTAIVLKSGKQETETSWELTSCWGNHAQARPSLFLQREQKAAWMDFRRLELLADAKKRGLMWITEYSTLLFLLWVFLSRDLNIIIVLNLDKQLSNLSYSNRLQTTRCKHLCLTNGFSFKFKTFTILWGQQFQLFQSISDTNNTEQCQGKVSWGNKTNNKNWSALQSPPQYQATQRMPLSVPAHSSQSQHHEHFMITYLHGSPLRSSSAPYSHQTKMWSPFSLHTAHGHTVTVICD